MACLLRRLDRTGGLCSVPGKSYRPRARFTTDGARMPAIRLLVSTTTSALGLVIVTAGDPERAEHEMFDEGRIAERLKLAAAAHGLGAGVTWLKGEGPERAKELLGIPPHKRVRTVVSIGRRDEAAIEAKARVAQPRRESGDVVRWERY